MTKEDTIIWLWAFFAVMAMIFARPLFMRWTKNRLVLWLLLFFTGCLGPFGLIGVAVMSTIYVGSLGDRRDD